MSPVSPNLARLLARAAARRRLADTLWVLARVALPAGLWLGAIALVAVNRFGAPPAWTWVSVAVVPFALGWAWLRPHSRRKLARRLDGFYGLDDQLGSALEFDGRHLDKLTPRTRAVVELVRARAEALAANLDVRAPYPLRFPSPRAWDGLAVLALVLATMVVPPPPPATAELVEPVDETMAIPSVAHKGVDLALAAPLRQSLAELAKGDDEPAQAAAQMLEILDALERGDLDRALALAQLEELERQIAEAEAEFDEALTEDPASLAQALDDLADAFEEQPLTAEAGRALDHGDGKQAEQALQQAEAQAEADAGADEQLRQALADAERRLGAQDQAQHAQTAKDLDEAERRLRKDQKREPKTPQEAEEHERRLKRQQERVEQLRRQHERELAAQKRVEQLRRNAEQAARNRAGSAERKQALERLGSGMKSASRMARGASRMQGARDGMEEAKTLVRKAGSEGAGDATRREQFRRFDAAAKGNKGKDGPEGKGKDRGQGKSTLLVEGDVGDGPPAGIMELPGEGQGPGEGDGVGEGAGDRNGDGSPGNDGGQGDALGDAVGDGTQDPLAAAAGMDVRAKDVRVNARAGRGVSKAEILKDASQRGFASEPYRDMVQEYRDFAQSTIESEAFPAAKRRLVKRYYQLIQGR